MDNNFSTIGGNDDIENTWNFEAMECSKKRKDEENKEIDNPVLIKTEKYRCEQTNITRVNGKFLTSTIQKFQYVVGLNTKEKQGFVQQEEHYYQITPKAFKMIFDFITLTEKIRNNVVVEYDENGKISSVLNKKEQSELWHKFKKSSEFETEFVKSLRNADKKAYNNMIEAGDKRFSLNYKSEFEYQATLFYSIMFNRHLTWCDDYLLKPEKLMFASSLLEKITYPLVAEYKIIKESTNEMEIVIDGYPDIPDHVKNDIKEQYVKSYQPIIKYNFTNYIMNYHLCYRVNKKTSFVEEAKLSIVEAVEYNVEQVCDFILHKL